MALDSRSLRRYRTGANKTTQSEIPRSLEIPLILGTVEL